MERPPTCSAAATLRMSLLNICNKFFFTDGICSSSCVLGPDRKWKDCEPWVFCFQHQVLGRFVRSLHCTEAVREGSSTATGQARIDQKHKVSSLRLHTWFMLNVQVGLKHNLREGVLFKNSSYIASTQNIAEYYSPHSSSAQLLVVYFLLIFQYY